MNCKNIICKQPLTEYNMEMLSSIKRPNQCRYRFCVKCRGSNNISIHCVDCEDILYINNISQHKCVKCTRLAKKQRDKKRNKNDSKIHERMQTYLSQPRTITELSDEFKISPESLKFHLSILREKTNLIRESIYRIE